MFFSLRLLDVVFSLKRGYCVHIKQQLKIESMHFWKKSAYDAERCARWIGVRWGGVAEAVLRLLSVCTGGEWGFSKGGGGFWFWHRTHLPSPPGYRGIILTEASPPYPGPSPP